MERTGVRLCGRPSLRLRNNIILESLSTFLIYASVRSSNSYTKSFMSCHRRAVALIPAKEHGNRSRYKGFGV
jgi:hypothetical protein